MQQLGRRLHLLQRQRHRISPIRRAAKDRTLRQMRHMVADDPQLAIPEPMESDTGMARMAQMAQTMEGGKEGHEMNVSKRAWDMLSEGRSVDEVRIATGFSKAVLEAMLRDIERDRIRRNGS